MSERTQWHPKSGSTETGSAVTVAFGRADKIAVAAESVGNSADEFAAAVSAATEKVWAAIALARAPGAERPAVQMGAVSCEEQLQSQPLERWLMMQKQQQQQQVQESPRLACASAVVELVRAKQECLSQQREWV